MCTTCGCSAGDTTIDGRPVHDDAPHADARPHAHDHGHDHAHDHGHDHAHDHAHPHDHDHAHGARFAQHAHAPGMPAARTVRIERDILERNDAFAHANRQALAERAVFAVNLVSSPGSGKTELLVRTIEALAGRLRVAVIEGDQQTSVDADRIRATGARAVQINTGKGCHLDAHAVGHALERIGLADGDVLMIENVGNLVCPAAFDLGEAAKVVVLSVTEGEDKPLKYPDMFAASRLMLLNKIDLLPYLSFDVARCIGHARRVNPEIAVLAVSARTGEGLDAWLDWIARGAEGARCSRDASVAALRRRVAELEAQLAGRGD